MACLKSSVLIIFPESKEPSFLRKLKTEFGGHSDRHERPIARPQKPRDTDEDDEPTYVDEESHEVISKTEYATMLHAGDRSMPLVESRVDESVTAGLSKQAEPIGESGKTQAPKKEAVAAIGGSAKRRIVKVVGEEDNSYESTKDRVTQGKEKKDVESPSSGKKNAKRARKIKLAFEEE